MGDMAATVVAMEAMEAMVATVEAMAATAMARGPLMLSPRLMLRPTGAAAMAATAMARGPLMPSPDMAMAATDAATEATVVAMEVMVAMAATTDKSSATSVL